MSLDILQGAVTDAAGNPIGASSNNTVSVRDTTKPAISSAAYYIGNGTVSVQFTEPITAANGVSINVTHGDSTLQLRGAVASNDAVTATLNFEDRIKISGITSLNLTIPAGAIRDVRGNQMDTVSDMPLDVVFGEDLGFAVAASVGASNFGANDFVTTWNATDKSITIYVDGHTGTYTVNWGDGTNPTTQSGNTAHTYASAGLYNVSISGDFQRFTAGDSANAAKLVALVQWGNASWNSMGESFRDASNMVYKAVDAPDLSRVANMSGMFFNASAFNGDLSSWDTSSVTNMKQVFWHASAFNGNLSTWDVSAVTDMSSMFA